MMLSRSWKSLEEVFAFAFAFVFVFVFVFAFAFVSACAFAFQNHVTNQVLSIQYYDKVN